MSEKEKEPPRTGQGARSGHGDDEGRLNRKSSRQVNLPSWLRGCLSEFYDEAAQEPLPKDFEELLEHLDSSEKRSKG